MTASALEKVLQLRCPNLLESLQSLKCMARTNHLGGDFLAQLASAYGANDLEEGEIERDASDSGAEQHLVIDDAVGIENDSEEATDVCQNVIASMLDNVVTKVDHRVQSTHREKRDGTDRRPTNYQESPVLKVQTTEEVLLQLKQDLQLSSESEGDLADVTELRARSPKAAADRKSDGMSRTRKKKLWRKTKQVKVVVANSSSDEALAPAKKLISSDSEDDLARHRFKKAKKRPKKKRRVSRKFVYSDSSDVDYQPREKGTIPTATKAAPTEMASATKAATASTEIASATKAATTPTEMASATKAATTPAIIASAMVQTVQLETFPKNVTVVDRLLECYIEDTDVDETALDVNNNNKDDVIASPSSPDVIVLSSGDEKETPRRSERLERKQTRSYTISPLTSQPESASPPQNGKADVALQEAFSVIQALSASREQQVVSLLNGISNRIKKKRCVKKALFEDALMEVLETVNFGDEMLNILEQALADNGDEVITTDAFRINSRPVIKEEKADNSSYAANANKTGGERNDIAELDIEKDLNEDDEAEDIDDESKEEGASNDVEDGQEEQSNSDNDEDEEGNIDVESEEEDALNNVDEEETNINYKEQSNKFIDNYEEEGVNSDVDDGDEEEANIDGEVGKEYESSLDEEGDEEESNISDDVTSSDGDTEDEESNTDEEDDKPPKTFAVLAAEAMFRLPKARQFSLDQLLQGHVEIRLERLQMGDLRQSLDTLLQSSSESEAELVCLQTTLRKKRMRDYGGVGSKSPPLDAPKRPKKAAAREIWKTPKKRQHNAVLPTPRCSTVTSLPPATTPIGPRLKSMLCSTPVESASLPSDERHSRSILPQWSSSARQKPVLSSGQRPVVATATDCKKPRFNLITGDEARKSRKSYKVEFNQAKNGLVDCKHCDETLQKEAMRIHLLKHENGCDVCGEDCINKKRLQEHMRRNHINDMHRCACCNISFRSQIMLHRHFRTEAHLQKEELTTSILEKLKRAGLLNSVEDAEKLLLMGSEAPSYSAVAKETQKPPHNPPADVQPVMTSLAPETTAVETSTGPVVPNCVSNTSRDEDIEVELSLPQVASLFSDELCDMSSPATATHQGFTTEAQTTTDTFLAELCDPSCLTSAPMTSAPMTSAHMTLAPMAPAPMTPADGMGETAQMIRHGLYSVI